MTQMEYGVPEIYKYESTGNLGNLYIDIQYILKVPIVNFVFRTLAFYEKFLTTAWGLVRSNMLTNEMEQAAEKLRYPDISLNAPNVNWTEEYDSATMEQIRRIVFTFNYVNPKLLLLVSAWKESLSNRPIQGTETYEQFITPGIIQGLPNIHLVKINKTSPVVHDLLLDIIKKHHAYDAASDYRALANFPTFLGESWAHLKPYVGSKEYTLLEADLKTRATQIVHGEMPFPVTIDTDFLYRYYSPSDIAGIMGIVSMFQNLLPSLIIEGEFFRRMIE